MESFFLQNIRYKLQKRVRRLNGADLEQFVLGLKPFFAFLNSTPILTALIDQLAARVPSYAEDANRAAGGGIISENDTKSAAIGYGVLRVCAERNDINAVLTRVPPSRETARMLDTFRTMYLEPFYEYIDENLDDRSFVLFSLIRYKEACEWFRRDRLYQGWVSDTRKGETYLAYDLYEYLHERGIAFHIEPVSASGEADMVALQSDSSEPLIADAKIFNPDHSKGKPYLIRGFRQVYQYTCDYNQPVGYVIIFNTSDRPLRFAFADTSGPLPHVVHNHKTIYFVAIDIYPHEQSASKRPAGNPVEFTDEDFIPSVSAEPEAIPPQE